MRTIALLRKSHAHLPPLALRETKWYGLVRAAKRRLDPQSEQAITRAGGEGWRVRIITPIDANLRIMLLIRPHPLTPLRKQRGGTGLWNR